ncbi:hypothetical protein JW968_02125 [Candidatus Woesearchaeota archaeon]|nr:hypothetical protein [Candidatus Woesearchaeota archaeon]
MAKEGFQYFWIFIFLALLTGFTLGFFIEGGVKSEERRLISENVAGQALQGIGSPQRYIHPPDFEKIDCLNPAEAAPGNGDAAYLFSLDDPRVYQMAQEALYWWSAVNGTPYAELDTSDEYLEAISNYVHNHVYLYIPGDGSEETHLTVSDVLDRGGSPCCNSNCPYCTLCADCQEHTNLKTALLRSLGVSWRCVFTARGSHSHEYNIVLYKNAYRVMDWGPIGDYFNSATRYLTENNGAFIDYDTTTIYNDHVGNFHHWSLHPSVYTWNYPGNSEKCPAGGWDQSTYYSDICPGFGLQPAQYKDPEGPKVCE